MEQIKTFTAMDSHEEKLQKIIMEVRKLSCFPQL